MMYEDEILQELWKVKEKLSEEYARDPKAYWQKLRDIGEKWENRHTKSTVSRKSAKLVKKSAPKKAK
jgi:hypothetical protein